MVLGPRRHRVPDDPAGQGELVYGELLGVDEVIARIDAVTPDDVRSIAREVLGATPTLAVIGPFDDADRLAAAVA